MVTTVIQIDGMACSMCEAHVNDAIRRAFAVKKVRSSHAKGRAEIVSEEHIDQARLRSAIEATGYSVKGISSEPYDKKGFSLFSRK